MISISVFLQVKFTGIYYNPKLSDVMKLDSWEKSMQGVEDLLMMLTELGDTVTTRELIMEDHKQLEQAPYRCLAPLAPAPATAPAPVPAFVTALQGAGLLPRC